MIIFYLLRKELISNLKISFKLCGKAEINCLIINIPHYRNFLDQHLWVASDESAILLKLINFELKFVRTHFKPITKFFFLYILFWQEHQMIFVELFSMLLRIFAQLLLKCKNFFSSIIQRWFILKSHRQHF